MNLIRQIIKHTIAEGIYTGDGKEYRIRYVYVPALHKCVEVVFTRTVGTEEWKQAELDFQIGLIEERMKNHGY